MQTDTAPVLLVSEDSLLLSDVTRLAAAAGVVPRVVADPTRALAMWPGAATVLVGADAAPAMARARPPRRAGVHLVERGASAEASLRAALELGAESLSELPAQEAWLVELLTDVGDGAGGRGRVLGVLGGSGGVGASVLAAATAQSAARQGASVLLLDADPLGAGADRLLGMEQLAGSRWDSLAQVTGRLSGRSMRESLPQREGLSVLTWPAEAEVDLPAAGMREVLSAGVRGFDLMVLDLPRRFGSDVGEAMARCDQVALVVAATLPGVASAARVARGLEDLVACGVVVHTQRGGLRAADVGSLLGLPIWSEVARQRGLSEAIDLGAGPLHARRGPVARAAREIADRAMAGAA